MDIPAYIIVKQVNYSLKSFAFLMQIFNHFFLSCVAT